MTSSLTLKPLRYFESPGRHLCGLAWDGTHLWHSDGDTHSLYRLDRETGRIIAKLYCPEVRTGLAFEGGRLWQVAGHPKRIRVIRTQDGQTDREIPLGSNAELVCGLAVQGDSYWIGPESKGFVEQYFLGSLKPFRRYGPLASGDGIALVGSSLWVTSCRDCALIRFDLETATETARYSLIGNPTGMCFDGSMFWYNDFRNKRISAVQPEH